MASTPTHKYKTPIVIGIVVVVLVVTTVTIIAVLTGRDPTLPGTIAAAGAGAIAAAATSRAQARADVAEAKRQADLLVETQRILATKANEAMVAVEQTIPLESREQKVADGNRLFGEG